MAWHGNVLVLNGVNERVENKNKIQYTDYIVLQFTHAKEKKNIS